MFLWGTVALVLGALSAVGLGQWMAVLALAALAWVQLELHREITKDD